MDNYTEQILDCKPSNKSNAMFAGGIAAIILGVFMFLSVDLTIGFILVIAGIFLVVFGTKGQRSEFEYLFINGDLEIARINNKTSRKNVYEMNESDVLRILPYSSPKGKNELEVNKKLTIRDFTSGNDKNSDSWYIFITNVKNGTDAVVLELNEKNVNHCTSVFKQKFEK